MHAHIDLTEQLQAAVTPVLLIHFLGYCFVGWLAVGQSIAITLVHACVARVSLHVSCYVFLVNKKIMQSTLMPFWPKLPIQQVVQRLTQQSAISSKIASSTIGS